MKRRAHPPPSAAHEGVGRDALEVGRTRLLAIAGVFAVACLVLAARLVEVSVLQGGEARAVRSGAAALVARADIVDRNGVILATSLRTASLYANPRELIDPVAAAAGIAAVLPDLGRGELLGKLSSDRSFVWLKRSLTPKQQYAINRLGFPGIGFVAEQRRVYPQGALTAHAVGFAGVDNRGLTGHRDELRFGADRRRRSAAAAVARRARAERAARGAGRRGRRVQGAGRRRSGARRTDGRGLGAGLAARLRSQPSGRGECRVAFQPRQPGRLRDGLDLQDVHDGDGAGFGDDRPERRLRRHRAAARRPLHHPRRSPQSGDGSRCPRSSSTPRTSAPRRWPATLAAHSRKRTWSGSGCCAGPGSRSPRSADRCGPSRGARSTR